MKKETLAQVFSSEFCEISKNTFLKRTPLVAASVTSVLVNIATKPQPHLYSLHLFGEGQFLN